MSLFQDRADAGQQVAKKLTEYSGRADVIILGLARSGMPVAFEVARTLNLPLDVLVVRKLGLPGHEELSIGAITSGGMCLLNKDVIDRLRISQEVIEAISHREQQELDRREQEYRDNRPPVLIRGRTVILVDDGLATDATFAVAVAGLRALAPSKILLAVPVAAPETVDALAKIVDRIIYAETPQPFFGIGLWYGDFSQVRDEEVHDLLARAANDFGSQSHPSTQSCSSESNQVTDQLSASVNSTCGVPNYIFTSAKK